VKAKATTCAVGTALLGLGLLAGCGGQGAAQSASGNGGSQPQLSLILGTTNNDFYVTMGCGARAEAKAKGAALDVQGPTEFSADLQVPIVNAVTAKHPDAVMIAPTDSQALIPPMRQMKEAGIKTVEVDTKVADDSLAVSQVTSDNVLAGKKAADEINKLTGGHGSVLVVSNTPGISTSDARGQGFMQEIKKYPGLHGLPIQYNNDDATKAAQIITSTLAAHPDLSGVFATAETAAEGVATGLKGADTSGKVSMVGFDAGPTQIQALKAGDVQALVAQEPYREGQAAVDQALKAVSGKPTVKEVRTGLAIVTKDNLATSGSKYVYKSAC